jgi:tRNA 2-selenouridine synthase
MREEYAAAYNEHADQRYSENLLASLARIKKRLGLQRYAQLDKIMRRALEAQLQHNDCEYHRQWIEILLRDYYDPMYEYQLGKVGDRVVFRGSHEALEEWAENQ